MSARTRLFPILSCLASCLCGTAAAAQAIEFVNARLEVKPGCEGKFFLRTEGVKPEAITFTIRTESEAILGSEQGGRVLSRKEIRHNLVMVVYQAPAAAHERRLTLKAMAGGVSSMARITVLGPPAPAAAAVPVEVKAGAPPVPAVPRVIEFVNPRLEVNPCLESDLILTTKFVRPEEIVFTILDDKGTMLGAAEGGRVLSRKEICDNMVMVKYQAPAVVYRRLLTLQATAEGASGNTVITVLGPPPPAPRAVPWEGKAAAGADGDQDPRSFREGRWCFLDLANRKRFSGTSGSWLDPEPGFDCHGVPHPTGPRPFGSSMVTVGFGRPLGFKVSPRSGEGSCLCSIQDVYPGKDGGVTRLELGAEQWAEIRLRGTVWHFTVEDLRLLEGKEGKEWRSQLGVQYAMVRGLCPLAGAREMPGIVDGKGFHARLGTFRGLAWAPEVRCGDQGSVFIDGLPDKTYRQGWVFTEEGSNAVRIADMAGRVRILCGDPAAGGHEDGKGAAARFRQPGRVAVGRSMLINGNWGRVREDLGGHAGGAGERHHTGAITVVDAPPDYSGQRAFVVDVGNHCIREVNLQTGAVATLRLTDGATLVNPQGLWAHRYGSSLVVADQGDGLVKQILDTGQVRVLAGHPAHGHTFTDLRAVTSDPGPHDHGRCHYVLDGNALCVIDGGQVRVLAGAVHEEGYADSPEPKPGVACFRQPSDLVCTGRFLYILDRGNHVLRRYDLKTGELTTLAGDPSETSLRWGLLRDGLGEWPGQSQDYAALGDARVLAGCTWNPYLGVGASNCLGLVIAPEERTDRWVPCITPLPPAAPPRAGAPCRFAFTVGPAPGEQPWEPIPDHAFDFEYWITHAGVQVKGAERGRFGAPVTVTLPALAPGENLVDIRCVTLDGYSVGTKVVIDATKAGEPPAAS